MRTLHSFKLSILFVLCIVCVLFSTAAQAATITVVNLSDSGTGSLRQAIADAGAGDEIEFAANLAGQTIVTLSTLTLSSDVTITGPGTGTDRITIDAQDSHRAIDIDNPAIVLLRNLIITNGNSGGTTGGGISNGGTLTIRDCDVTSSSTTSNGGGIFSANGSNMVMERCLISGNNAGYNGGGIGLNGSSSSFQISDTVITNNTADLDGGGLSALNVGVSTPVLVTACEISSNTAENGGGIRASDAFIDVTNCTIAGNSARNNGGGLYSTSYPQHYAFSTFTDNTSDSDDTDGGDGSGVYSENNSARFKHCLIAGNLDNSSSGNQYDDFSGNGQYQGYIIFRDQSGASLSHDAGDPSGDYGIIEHSLTAPEALADNGGDTKTCALGDGHPALDKTTDATTWDGDAAVTTDQRGERRPSGNKADIGAYEKFATIVPIGAGVAPLLLLN